MLKLSKNMETIAEEIKTEQQPSKERAKLTICFMAQLQIAKISLQVLESHDFREAIVKNIRNAIG